MWHKYMQVAKALGLPEMNSTRVTVDSEHAGTPEKLLSLLRKHLQSPGWICFQDAVVPLPAERLPEDLGYPLSAEIGGANSSLRVLPDGQGGWSIISVNESEKGEIEVLYDSVQHIGNRLAPGALQYRRYWKKDDDNGYVAFATRFTGFSREGA